MEDQHLKYDFVPNKRTDANKHKGRINLQIWTNAQARISTQGRKIIML